ncbi:hypothetical protein scyTo_0020800 [Scyliorhinus torazame]|uniref:Uncharacterized protein n=1 Tax=Scyliorhinus torazame TaxID=75743 RepID=A0A401PNU5_SCYTO|nr:hypothetical protein [Scyliorhinus torazame]
MGFPHPFAQLNDVLCLQACTRASIPEDAWDRQLPRMWLLSGGGGFPLQPEPPGVHRLRLPADGGVAHVDALRGMLLPRLWVIPWSESTVLPVIERLK